MPRGVSMYLPVVTREMVARACHGLGDVAQIIGASPRRLARGTPLPLHDGARDAQRVSLRISRLRISQRASCSCARSVA